MKLAVDGREAFIYTGGRAFDPALPCIVFVHGAENDHSVWALQSRYFAHHGHGVLVPDLPGHGRSPGPALASIEAIADWVGALLVAAGVNRAVVVGHSMGALIALETAHRHPAIVERIALLGPAVPMKVSDELLAATANDEPRARRMINVWCHAATAHYPGNPGPGSWVIGGNARLLARQPIGTLHIDFKACNDYTGGAAAAASIGCPVLLLVASRDVMTPARGAKAFAATFANARVTEIAGSGHNLMGEKPDEVLDALLAMF